MSWPGKEDSGLEKGSEEKIAAANERWDALFASAEGQKLLDYLVEQAKADIEAGRVYGTTISAEGELSPDELSNCRLNYSVNSPT